MSLDTRNSRLRRFGLAAIAACALGTAALSTAPAEAAVRVFAGPGGLHVGIVQHPHHDWWRHHHYWRHDGWYR